MVHHIALYKLRPGTPPAVVEHMIRETRMQLLKIPEVLNVRCGKQIDPAAPWPFFVSLDFESMDKRAIYLDDPIHIKYVEEIIRPHTVDSLVLDYEMEPFKDVKYS